MRVVRDLSFSLIAKIFLGCHHHAGKTMENNYSEIQEVLKAVPKDLPFYLKVLTIAGHLLAGGTRMVKEVPLHAGGAPGRALVFTPVIIEPEKKGGQTRHLNTMVEIRFNILLTIQEAAEECGVGYRTIQRWRDEHGLPVFPVKGKQFFASEILKEFAAKQGRSKKHNRWR